MDERAKELIYNAVVFRFGRHHAVQSLINDIEMILDATEPMGQITTPEQKEETAST